MPGYEASAVSERVGLVCPHCKLLLRDAVQTEEGVRLCQSCFKEIAWYVLQCMRSRACILLNKIHNICIVIIAWM